MDLNIQKEQFSIAYVRAVAAVAGVKVLRSDVDDDSIDMCLERSGCFAPKLDLQLKCTAAPLPSVGDISCVLKLKNYEDLRRQPVVVPRWLVVLFVPEDIAKWLTLVNPPTEVLLRHCAWWLSLAGLPEVDNEASVTVRLPHRNLFTPEALKAKFDDIENLFRPL